MIYRVFTHCEVACIIILLQYDLSVKSYCWEEFLTIKRKKHFYAKNPCFCKKTGFFYLLYRIKNTPITMPAKGTSFFLLFFSLKMIPPITTAITI